MQQIRKSKEGGEEERKEGWEGGGWEGGWEGGREEGREREGEDIQTIKRRASNCIPSILSQEEDRNKEGEREKEGQEGIGRGTYKLSTGES